MVLNLPLTMEVFVSSYCNWYSSHFLDLLAKNSRNYIASSGVISSREPSLEASTILFVLGDMSS